MTQPPSFSQKLLIGFLAAALGALVLSLFLMSREDYGADRYGASSSSISALGYAGIVRLLNKLGVPAVASRSNSVMKAKGGVLVLAEPALTQQSETAMPHLLRADKILLILPKWSGLRGEARGGWIERVKPRWPFDAKRTLAFVEPRAQVDSVALIGEWTTNRIGAPPPLKSRVQVIKSEEFRPIVASGSDILLGEIHKNGRLIWVLSDPDLIANHAFGPDGKNAAFAVKLIEALRGAGGTVVFDEAVHSRLTAGASAARLLFEFPYSIVTLQIAIGIALLLWATMGRFGPPETAPEPLPAGKAGLVDNVARLMAFAGHEKLMIKRYVEAMIADTARQLHAPKSLTQPELIEWLRRAGKARNVSLDGPAVIARADALIRKRGMSDISPFVGVARDIYRWKQEILDGPSRHPRHNGGRARRSPEGGGRPG